MTLDIEIIEQQSPLLGRQKVHDEQSRAFPVRTVVDKSTWKDKRVRIYDPYPNPNQCHGECTATTKMMQLNSVGNRKMGTVLKMHEAHINYAQNTIYDPFTGTFTYNPVTKVAGGADTGSSGLASCKSAVLHKQGGDYRHVFGGADEAIQLVQEGWTVSIGTWWYESMFGASRWQDGLPVFDVRGSKVGGHQYLLRGYDYSSDMPLCRTWWGGIRDFFMTRTDLNDLMLDGGDGHIQKRV